MANVKISSLSTLSGTEVSGNDLFLLSTSNLQSRSLSISNARIAISDANDYITYAVLNSNLVNGLNSANANLYSTYLVAYANDGTTLGLAYSNDGATLASARANDYASFLTLSGGITGANASIATKDSISNVYYTYMVARGGIEGANTSILNLQSGLVGSNSAILSLQGGLVGANAINDAQRATIDNVITGLSGANSSISAITSSPVTFQSDVTIRGNLTLTGNTTIVSANTISFGDSLISLAANNTISDNLDVGLYGHYWNGSANSHTGIFRSAASKEWMLFSNYTIDLEGNSVIDISNSSFSLANIRVRTANASQDIRAANSVISSSVFSNGVELRSNDYATYLMALGGLSGANTSILNLQGGISGANNSLSSKDSIANVYATWNYLNSNVVALQGGISGANDSIATKDSIANVYATYLVAKGGIDGANTNIAAKDSVANVYATWNYLNSNVVSLQGGLTGTNTTVATKDSIANVYSTYLTAMSNDYITYTRLYANVNSVQSNLTAYAAYANATFSTSVSSAGNGTLAYVFSNYITSTSNSYYIGATVTSVNNVQVYIDGVYQSKNSYILGNSSSNIQFLDSTITSGRELNIETLSIVNVNGVNTAALESNVAALQGGLASANTAIALKANIASPSFTGKVYLGQASVTNNDPTTNWLSLNDNGAFYDDGNLHIHSRLSGQAMWINTNNGQIIIGNQSPVSGGAAASAITMGSSTTAKAYLSVYGSKTYTIGAYGYTASGGTGTGAGTTAPYSIYSDNRMNASEFDATSDERAKDIQGTIPLETAINFVKKIDGIHYTWNSDAVDHDDKGLKAGFGAQAVHKAGFDHMIGVIPNEKLKEQIDEDGWIHPEGMQLTMGYNQVIPYHHEVIKHLLNKIEDLEKKLNDISSK